MMRFTAVVVAALALCLAGSSVALGTTGHGFLDNFGLAGASVPGGFTYPGPGGVAVRQSTGDVFVADPFNVDSVSSAAAPRVERFDAAGVFQSEFAVDAGTYSAPGAVAIGPSGGNDVVYVGAVATAASTGAVLTYSPAGVAGTPLSAAGSGSSFANPVTIAADPVDGTVYVSAVDATSGLPVIDKFSSTGVFQTKFDGSSGAPGGAALTTASSLAVDGAHHLYVSDGVKVYRYSAAGAFELTLDDPSVDGYTVQGIAADATSNEIYVNEPSSPFSGRIRVFSPAGVQTQPAFATAAYATNIALAVNQTTKTVYTTDANNVAGARYAAFVGPTVTTGSGATIDPNNETLSGAINPEGVAGTTYHFEYGPDTTYGAFTPDADPGSGSSAVSVSDTATSLSPHTTYHFRLVGVNPSGTIYGDDSTFVSAPAAPVVDGSPGFASAITPNGASLTGFVDPLGSDTSYHFEYGIDTTYGSVSAPDGTIVASQGSQPASSTITGLAADTTYHFRVVADNGTGGLQTGADQTFITAPAVAAGATDVTAVRALLTGVVNPRGNPATYHFEYTRPGSPSPVTATTAETDIGAPSTDTAVTASSGPLSPGTTYTVRVVVTDTATGFTTSGAEGTFSTDPAPQATTGAVTGVTTDHATFSGSYDTHGRQGSYQFVIGSSTSPYLAKTDPIAISGSGTASGVLDKLPAGQTYKVRLAVTSRGTTTSGDAVTFATAPQPAVLPTPPAEIAQAASSYGCTAPVLAAYDAHPKPGTEITITGTDLGVGGNVTLATSTLTPSAWSANGFTITVPDDATGSLALTVNCGTVSNTVAIQIYQAPSNTFTATVKAGKTASTATVSAKVPGPGSITISGASLKTVTKHASKAATTTVKAKLTAKAIKSLKRHHKLTVTLNVRFTPTGGTSRTIAKTVTFTGRPGH